MTRPFDRYDTFDAALANPAARKVLEELVPDLLQSSIAAQLGGFPLGPFLEFALAPDEARAATVLAALSRVDNTAPDLFDEPPFAPEETYESDAVALASASVTSPATGWTHRPTELTFDGPSHGNPFVEVDLVVDFRRDDIALTVGGFYDGDGRYLVRFLPPASGDWRWTTRSNARSLRGIEGSIHVDDTADQGPVRVEDTFGFAYASGERFTPVGTTAYAWVHQSEEVQQRTLASLAAAPFNKLRMCLFPKDFLYNSNEPDRFVFAKAADGSFDTTRFDVQFFRRLEERITQLGQLGIEADLILFHPYDRWGFSKLGPTVDDRYVRYAVRRLAAFPNVWWSMANEYELLTTKRPAEWHRLAQLVVDEDHVGHLLSIHNWSELFDYSASWATHASLQRGDRELTKRIDEWRATWGKPVIIDEFGYEGDLDQGWGNLTAEEVVERFWSATVRGGYLTHGETYFREDEEIFWAKGGTLTGQSPARIGFLRQIVDDSPTGRIEPLPSDWDVPWGGVADEYILLYFGARRPLFRIISLPAGMVARVDVIDTWNMTIAEIPGIHEGTVRISLPARPYMAVRLRAA